VVIATGGRSLPKTGSDGAGYDLVHRLGHGHVETTPALAPLLLGGHGHAALAGVSHQAVLSLRVNGRTTIRLEGSLLWTHFGMSGPVVLNLSRHWHRARLRSHAPGARAAAGQARLRSRAPAARATAEQAPLGGTSIEVVVNLLPGESFESLEAWWLAQERERPRAQVATILATRVPAAVAGVWLDAAGIASDSTMSHVARDHRRRLVRALVESPVRVVDSRGYGYAEVTAGGIPLDEIDAATMQSRLCPGLYLVGEILDVDGRLGGFNFQWAWSSGWVAGHAIAKALS
jgi:hypothetical protein